MKRRTFVRPEAQTEREPGLGLRFLGQIRTSLEHINDNPLMFPIIDEEVRRALVQKFPYSIYFVNESDSIGVIAVLHQHRRPDAWKSRR